MKRFLRRANRGLILAALILVGVIIYVLVDNAQFKSAEPEIQRQVKQYLEEVKTVNLKDMDAKVDAARELVEKYWCDGSSGLSDSGLKMDRQEALEYLKQVEAQGGDHKQVTDYTDVVRSVNVVKNGPGCAKATVAYDVSMGFNQEVGEEGYRIYGLQGDSYYYYGSGIQSQEDGFKISGSYVFEFLLYEKDGGWKIGSVDYQMADEY